MRQLLLLGSPFWTTYLQDRLQALSVDATALRHNSGKDLARAFSSRSATLLAVGYGARLNAKLSIIWAFVFIWWLLNRRSRSVFLYWIGGDVLSGTAMGAHPLLLRLWNVMSVRHLCGAPWFVEVLEEIGVYADPVLFPYDTAPAEALSGVEPATDGMVHVCTYLTRSNWDNMNGNTIMKLATDLTGSCWTIVGMSREQVPPEVEVSNNVNFLGWVKDPLAAIAKSHVFIRLANHDAYSGMVRDAQAMGRAVVYTKDVPGVVFVSTSDPTGILPTMRRIRKKLASGQAASPPSADLPSFEAQIHELVTKLALY